LHLGCGSGLRNRNWGAVVVCLVVIVKQIADEGRFATFGFGSAGDRKG